MKILRLLVTKECNHNCSGCCNKQWDLDKLPIITDFSEYDEIIITGGEPMLFGNSVKTLADSIRLLYPNIKLILYTTKIHQAHWYCRQNFDGITVTLHEQYDVEHFYNNYNLYFSAETLRLNVFENVTIPTRYKKLFKKHGWIIKDNIKWIENCPLPENETFGKIKNLFQ